MLSTLWRRRCCVGVSTLLPVLSVGPACGLSSDRLVWSAAGGGWLKATASESWLRLSAGQGASARFLDWCVIWVAKAHMKRRSACRTAVLAYMDLHLRNLLCGSPCRRTPCRHHPANEKGTAGHVCQVCSYPSPSCLSKVTVCSLSRDCCRVEDTSICAQR